MDEKQIATTRLVLKKIAALRATCSDDEREILDRFFSGRVSYDVEGHIVVERTLAGPAERASQSIQEDVVANIMSEKASLERIQASAQDTEAHISSAGSITYRLWYDKEKQAYRLEM